MRSFLRVLLAATVITTALFASASALYAAVPTVTGVAPNSGPEAGGTLIQITGSNFETPAVSAVAFDSTPAAWFLALSDTELIVLAPAGTGTTSIRVTNSSGQSTDTSADDFVFVAGLAGDLSLADKFVIASTGAPYRMVAADLNQDNKLDIAVAEGYGSALNLYRNNSTSGSLAFITDSALTMIQGTEGLAVGDFNDDSMPDLIVTKSASSPDPQQVSVFLNTTATPGGAITFSATRLDFTIGNDETYSPTAITAGDYNRDGLADFAVLQGFFHVGFYQNSWNGSTLGFSFQFYRDTDTIPVHITTCAFTNDGQPDVVLANLYGDNLWVYENQSSGGSMNFAATAVVCDVTVGPHASAFADFNQDGKMDLCAADGYNNSFSYFENTSATSISFGGNQNQSCQFGPYFIGTGDLDSDNRPDVITGDGDGLTLFKNVTTASNPIAFGPGVVKSGGQPGAAATAIACHDFDGDGRTDIAAILGNYGEVVVFRNSSGAPGATIDEQGGVAVTEGGAGDSYTIVLTKQPLADVIVTADPDSQLNLGSGAGTPVLFTFTNSTWSTPQTVTVTAVDDATVEGSHFGGISHYITSDDPNWEELALPGVQVSIVDNDGAVGDLTLQDPVNNPALSGSGSRSRLDPTDNYMGGGDHSFEMYELADAVSNGSLYQDTFNHVSLHNGNFTYTEDLHSVPGRGLDFHFIATYSAKRSHITGPLGPGWDHNYHTRLKKSAGNWILSTGFQQDLVFTPLGGGYYRGPNGNYSILQEDLGGDLAYVRNRHGMLTTFTLTGGDTLGRLAEIRDPNDNTLAFSYTGNDLTGITDSLGRAYSLVYSGGHLTNLNDFSGRNVNFNYDATAGTLLNWKYPEVTGTSTGNNFAGAGRRVKAFTYTVSADPLLNKKLNTIKNPNEILSGGPVYLTVNYYSSGTYKAWVQNLSIGGTNYAGNVPVSTIDYSYTGTPTASQTVVNDRNGNNTTYTIAVTGHVTTVSEPAEQSQTAVTQLAYNVEEEVTSVTLPMTNTIAITYDATPQTRYNTGNPVLVTRTPDAARGGAQAQIRTKFVIEPVYNHIYQTTDPRGMDSGYTPQNGGAWSEARYTTTTHCDYMESSNPGASLVTELLGQFTGTAINGFLSAEGVAFNLGDVNGDGATQFRGNHVATIHPNVLLIAGPQSAREGNTNQQSGVSVTYNSFGLVTSVIDEEENCSLYEYYTVATPGSGSFGVNNGGYLARVTRDTSALFTRNGTFFGDTGLGRESGLNPAMVHAKTDMTYNAAGMVITQTNPRGVRTDYEVSQADQTVKLSCAADVAAAASRLGGVDVNATTYTPANESNLVLPGQGAAPYDTLFFYTANGDTVATFTEYSDNHPGDSDTSMGSNPAVPGISFPSGTGYVENFSYRNILGNTVKTRAELNASDLAQTTAAYDANENKTLFTDAMGNQQAWTWGPRDLMLTFTRGANSALAATVSNAQIDVNRNVTNTLDAADNGGNAGGEHTLIVKDGYDRTVNTITAVGTEHKNFYGPASEIVKTETWGTQGGASPTENNTSGNVLLARAHVHFDEKLRQFRTINEVFNIAQSLDRAYVPDPNGTDVTTLSDKNRAGWQCFVVEDDGDILEWQYYGMGWVLTTIDTNCDCFNQIDTFRDDNGNAIVVKKTEMPSEGITGYTAPAAIVYLDINDCDALDRVVFHANNLKHADYAQYDSRGNLINSGDANGPTGYAYTATTGSVTNTNNIGNVNKRYFDVGGRNVKDEAILTAIPAGQTGTAVGDGTWNPAPNGGQGGGDGIIRTQTAFNLNSIPTSQTDDRGNVTAFTVNTRNETYRTDFAASAVPPIVPATFEERTIDGDGNVIGTLDANGSVIAFTFDGDNRQTQGLVTTFGGGVLQLSKYKQAEYNGLNIPTKTLDSNDDLLGNGDDIVNRYGVNSIGERLEHQQDIGAAPNMAVSARYQFEQDLKTLLYPKVVGAGESAARVDFGFENERDRVDTIDYTPFGGATVTALNADYFGSRYLNLGFGNGTAERFHDGSGNLSGYDGAQRVIALKHLKLAGGVDLQTLTRAFERTANCVSETRSQHNSTNPTQTAKYSSTGQINRFFHESSFSGGGTTSNPTWTTIDGAQNWIATTGASAPPPHVPNCRNENTNFNHSNAGEQISGFGNLVLGWDAWHRLRCIWQDTVSLESNETDYVDDPEGLEKIRASQERKELGLTEIACYNYNWEDQRVELEVMNMTPAAINRHEMYYYWGWEVLEDRNGADNSLLRQFILGAKMDQPVAVKLSTQSNLLYYHQNTQGSVLLLTDNAGAPVERYEYWQPYGRCGVYDGNFVFRGNLNTNSAYPNFIGNPLTWNCCRFGTEIDNFYMRYRYYSPFESQFLSRDPLGMWHDRVNIGNGQAFCGNNSLNMTDRMGLRSYMDRERSEGGTSVGENKDVKQRTYKPSQGNTAAQEVGTNQIWCRFECYCINCGNRAIASEYYYLYGFIDFNDSSNAVDEKDSRTEYSNIQNKDEPESTALVSICNRELGAAAKRECNTLCTIGLDAYLSRSKKEREDREKKEEEKAKTEGRDYHRAESPEIKKEDFKREGEE